MLLCNIGNIESIYLLRGRRSAALLAHVVIDVKCEQFHSRRTRKLLEKSWLSRGWERSYAVASAHATISGTRTRTPAMGSTQVVT